MSSQQKWWDDQQYLQKIGMQSQQDHMYDAVQFYHQESNVSLRIDRDMLQNRCMTAMDLTEEFDRFKKSRPDYAHPGPTNAELRHPSVRHAWEELQVIMRLAKGSRYEQGSR